MKWLLVLGAGLASLLALAPVQGAPAEGASTTGVNHVNGLGDDQHTSFQVHDYGFDSGPGGPDSGNFNYHNFTTGVSFNVDVECVEISGNRARFAFIIPAVPGEPLAGTARLIEVVDNGEPSAGPPPDFYGDTLGGITLAQACNFVNTLPAGALIYGQAITAGNIQVH